MKVGRKVTGGLVAMAAIVLFGTAACSKSDQGNRADTAPAEETPATVQTPGSSTYGTQVPGTGAQPPSDATNPAGGENAAGGE